MRKTSRRMAGLIAVAGMAGALAAANPVLTPGVWKDITPQGSSGDVWMVKISQKNPNYLYVGTGGSGLYASTDGGSTYRKSNVADYIAGLEIDPNDATHLYVGGWQNGDFWESTDAGVTWTKRPLIGSPDIGEITTDPSDFNHILVSWHYIYDDEGSFCESTDGGKSWKAIFIPGVQGASSKGVHFLYQPSLHIGDRNTWLITTEAAGFFRTSDAGATWTNVSTNNGLHGGLKGIYYTKGGVLYTGGQPCPVRSIDNGVTWESICGNMGSWYYTNMIGDGNKLYVGVAYPSAAYYTTPENGDGKTWTVGQTLVQGSGTWPFAFDTANHIMYMASGPAVFALKSLGTSATSATAQRTAVSGTKIRNEHLICYSGRMPDASARLYDVKGQKLAGRSGALQAAIIDQR